MVGSIFDIYGALILCPTTTDLGIFRYCSGDFWSCICESPGFMLGTVKFENRQRCCPSLQVLETAEKLGFLCYFLIGNHARNVVHVAQPRSAISCTTSTIVTLVQVLGWQSIKREVGLIDSSKPVVLKLGSARQFSGDREAPSKKINTTLLKKKFLCKIKFSGSLFFQTKLNKDNLELW